MVIAENKTTTSIVISKVVLKEAKLQARVDGTSVSVIIDKALKYYFEKHPL